MSDQAQPIRLIPTPYHAALCAHLKQHDPGAWSWFASARSQSDHTEALRLELLKRTYRLDRASHGDLYTLADTARERLDLDIPVTIYQAQHASALNAALYFIPGEAHIVIEGPMLTLLSPDEMLSVFGHELAHYRLWKDQDGDFLVTDRLVHAMANDPRAEPSHVHTARRLQLFTEIYADRGALIAGRDLKPVVAGLVKVQTGLASVSADSYLAQAAEIFSREQAITQGLSHPEAFIRARALALVADGHTDNADAAICRMINGPLALSSLDLLDQQRLAALTRRLLDALLAPAWFRTEPVLGQARLYFPDYQPPPAGQADDRLAHDLVTTDERLRDYLAYVMLDFSVVDPELDQVPLAAGFVLADTLDLGDRLEKLAAKELKLTKKEAAKRRGEASAIMAQAR